MPKLTERIAADGYPVIQKCHLRVGDRVVIDDDGLGGLFIGREGVVVKLNDFDGVVDGAVVRIGTKQLEIFIDDVSRV